MIQLLFNKLPHLSKLHSFTEPSDAQDAKLQTDSDKSIVDLGWKAMYPA